MLLAYRKDKSMIEVSITPHPTSDHHQLVLVEWKGQVYALTYAEPFPTEKEIRELWRHERKAFRPYDTTRGLSL